QSATRVGSHTETVAPLQRRWQGIFTAHVPPPAGHGGVGVDAAGHTCLSCSHVDVRDHSFAGRIRVSRADGPGGHTAAGVASAADREGRIRPVGARPAPDLYGRGPQDLVTTADHQGAQHVVASRRTAPPLPNATLDTVSATKSVYDCALGTLLSAGEA